MTDQALLQKLIEELQTAVDAGLLAPETLRIGGDVTDSIVVRGSHNTISIVRDGVAAKPDEQKMLAEALEAYRVEQSEDLQKIPDRPYPGLQPYDLQYAQRFFGRERAVADLSVALRQTKVVWLHSRSGAGKSSLIRAGLIPSLLVGGAFPIIVRPFDERPTTALKKELLRRRWSPELAMAKDTLLQFLARLAESLPGKSLYIFFDQFEEFFDKFPETEREEFSRELADCLADIGLPAYFIFCLRSDLFGDTLPLRERLQVSLSREFYLRPLTVDEARQIIVRPLEVHGVACQENLVDAILADLGSLEFNSPQLQLVCEKLFLALPVDEKQITLEQYEALGGARGIIGEYVRQVFRDPQLIPAEHARAASYLLSTLVTPEGRRDFRRFSDWVLDGRLRGMALVFHAEHHDLPMPNGVIDLTLLRMMAIADYTRQVEPHISLKGEVLRQLVEGLGQAVLDLYLYQVQKAFVSGLVNSLRQARLLHEIQTEDGSLAYELVHDYLVTEVQSWLEEDELEARRLKRMLAQRQLEFERHRFLLTAQELTLIAGQVENPKLTLGEADLRLLLVSAATTRGDGQPWLAQSGRKGVEWLREIYWDNRYPRELRLGTVACLGGLDDQATFDGLRESAVVEKDRVEKSFLLDLMATYRHHVPLPARLPWQLELRLFPRLARLRIVDGAAKRARMRRVSTVLAPLCTILMMLTVFLQRNNSISDHILATILLGILGWLAAYGFAETMTSLALVMHRWNWAWRALVLGVAGSLVGFILLYTLAGELGLWFEGGILGLALALFRQRPGGNLRWYPLTVGLGIGLLAALLTLVTLTGVKDGRIMELLGSVLSTGLFAGVYLYAVSQEN